MRPVWATRPTGVGQPVAPDGAVISPETADRYGLTGQPWTFLRLSTPTSSEPGAVPAGLDQASADQAGSDGPRRLTITDLTILGEEYSSGVILITGNDTGVNTCLVWAEPGTKTALREALPAVLAPTGTKPTVVDDRLFTGAFSRDYYADYQTRPWRWAPIAAGAILGVIWILIRWIRRAEDGLYQSLGIGRVGRTVIRITEWASYTYLAWGTALALSATATLILTAQPATMWPHIIRAVTLASATSMLTATLAGLLPARNPLDALKDR